MKKNIYIYLFLFIISYFFLYSSKYYIKDDYNEYKKVIIKHTRGFKITEENYLKIHKELSLKNKKIVLYSFKKEYIGLLILNRGMNKKYSFYSLNTGSNIVKETRLVTNDGSYFIFSGENPNKIVSTLFIKIKNNEYHFDISKDVYFIKYIKVDDDETLFDIYEKKCLDSQNNILF